MLQETRLHRIRSLISTHHQVSTERIITELGVSRETARRDIIALEQQGVARRVHGGIVAIEAPAELPLPLRYAAQEKEKRAIARCAVAQLHAGQTLFLDSGSTTTLLAQELRTMSGLTIITNSLQAALALTASENDSQLSHDVILLGGSMSAGTQQTQGGNTVNEIHRYQADVALLSPVGVDATNGASSFSPAEAAIAEAMAHQARQLILLADSSKLGITSRYCYARPADIQLLISDSQAPQHPAWSALSRQLHQVIVA